MSLQGERLPGESKLEIIVEHAMSLGLKNPSEPTYQSLVAMYMACQDGLSSATSANPSSKYMALQHVKSIFKRTVRKSTCSYWVPELPKDVAIFRESYKALYDVVFSEGPAVPSP